MVKGVRVRWSKKKAQLEENNLKLFKQANEINQLIPCWILTIEIKN